MQEENSLNRMVTHLIQLSAVQIFHKRHKDNTSFKLYSKGPKIRNRIQLGIFTGFFN